MLHIANIDSLNFPSSHYITRQATVLWLWTKTDYVKNIENCSMNTIYTQKSQRLLDSIKHE